MNISEFVQQYKIWLKNADAVSKDLASAFSEIKLATQESLHVFQNETPGYHANSQALGKKEEQN
ncbi:hypothetical protein [Brevibacillus agri]|uniref:hypothetical protein n=1 Tax=Brevibacillus agri TaxID=51101 RepID=UPI0018CCFF14|nr:hypothetical protein [Brevibacillus agri]MBG9568476.1 hypothetical protein [Brevibacillus agri]